MSGSAVTETGSPLQPPANETPLRDDGQHTQAWAAFYQNVAVTLAGLPDRLRTGVTDGSDAAAGRIGEYLTATAGPTPVSNNALANVVSLSLTPGDWDVSGGVVFAAGAGTHGYFGVGVAGVDVISSATFPTSAFQQAMATTTRRYNVTAPTTVWVVAQTGFTGTMTATGTIRARRMR